MLTPQEVSEHTFTKASFGSGGYNMAVVDEFLDLVTADYTTLYNDNAVLKSKLKVLADKVEEYRSTEDAMRKALMTAQRLADEMVREAEEKKAALLRDAEAEAAARSAELRREIQTEEQRLTAAQQATADYVKKVRALHEQGLAQLDSLSDLVVPAAASSTGADPVAVAAMQIEDTIQKLIADEMSSAAPGREEKDPFDTIVPDSEPTPEEPASDEDEDQEPTRRIDFDNLQFGRDFEIR